MKSHYLHICYIGWLCTVSISERILLSYNGYVDFVISIVVVNELFYIIIYIYNQRKYLENIKRMKQ